MNDFVAKLRANPSLAAGVGALVWVLPMLLFTGANGFAALMNAVGLMVVLVAVTMPFRTISLRAVASLFLMGGGAMGFALLGAWFNSMVFGNGPVRAISQPPLEEFLFLLPVAVVLFRWRFNALWTLGACDLMLMAAACGAGFAMVEEAFIRQKMGWLNAFSWLPIAELAGDRIRGYHVANGHAIWATLAGASVGMALVFRHRKEIALPLMIAGIGIGTIDHLALNMRDKANIDLSIFNFLLGNGYVTSFLFIAAVIAAMAVDWMVLYGKLRPPLLPTEPPVKGMNTLGWAAQLDLRSMVFAGHYLAVTPEKDKWMPQRMINFLFLRQTARKKINEGKLSPDASEPPAESEAPPMDMTPPADN
jgi:hypothetical protein